MSITINPTGYAFSGFYSAISGRVEVNNSALANASVIIDSPWGNFPAITDSTGAFSVNTQIPLLDFAFTGKLVASAVPPEAYYSPAQKFFSIDILNLLWINVPVIAAALTIYTASNLGLVPKLRTRLEKRAPKIAPTTTNEEELQSIVDNLSAQAISGPQPRLIAIYKEALGLAAKKFELSFKASSTIRERISLVRAADAGSESSLTFSNLSLIVEDYLYSASFNQEKTRVAEQLLSQLNSGYGPTANAQEEKKE